ncbi:putative RNA polymerase-associated protein Rtf1 [Medicago truncatula]|uniref:Putative RNA polymerase-associated protein Rtf1 n=1 Tax=Medicago truncatula TaxID=3880 RepID=A0A072UPW1_MEDTR|nr:protein RTF1 homolog [Medicago truncatula]KEH31113.1 RNA polymerase-associated RTF1-like protein [Medicago truncatula]RHN62467.1 putative RNA polymerase-associated protein Rtf1 [Medicago truncatula]
MADLENLLLEAAGRTGAAGRNRHSLPPSRRRRDGSYSDGGSDSRDDDSDDELNYASRKPSGSQVPLKKRLDPADRDDDLGSQEEADDDGRSDREGDTSDESNIGDDLYKDEDDRRKLSEMSELQREMILSDRASKKDDKSLLGKIASKREKGKAIMTGKQSPPLSSSRMRASARSADRSAKNEALNELRAKRLKQQDPEAHRRLREASRSSGPRNFSPPKRKSFTSANLSSSSHSDSESRSHSDDEGSTGDGGIADSDDDRALSGSEGLSFQDIKEITIRRSKLAKWFMEPFFEELIVGCFVRVGIGRSKTGPIYRLCMVKNVDSSDPDRQYKLENKTTYKYLNVVWGNESSAARWQMAMISDSPPLEEEYKQWVKEVERSGGRMPSKQDVLDKKQAINKIITFVYSAATVKQMIQEKKSASSRPLNIAAEKDRLRSDLERAQGKNDDAEVERIKARLLELEASRHAKVKDAKALKLAEMNRKNRVENFKNASELRPLTGLKEGDAGYDPFSRRWTRSRNYYVATPSEKAAALNNNTVGLVSDAGANGTGVPVTAESGAVATAIALEAAADAGKLVDTSAPVDQGTESNTLHNFELPVSLALLHKYGGAQGAQAGFMARKQRIESTVGFKLSENDGRRHVLTLSVGDYKRRRGLL